MILVRRFCTGLTRKLTLAVLVAISLPVGVPAAPGRVVIRGAIMNGSTAGPARVSELRLIALRGGMQVLHSLKNTGPSFLFSVERPKGPLLLRAVYKGQPYVLMIPPTPRFWNKQQRLIVYDLRPLQPGSSITPALQISKHPKEVRVTKIFAARNTSRYTIDPAGLAFTLPPGAERVRARLEHEATRMPTPIAVRKRADGRYGIARGFRPGSSALSVEFFLPGRTFSDRWPSGVRPTRGLSDRTMLVWWEPNDAVPRVTGGATRKVNTGKLGQALHVSYPSGTDIKYDVTAGAAMQATGRNVVRRGHETPLFGDAFRTLSGLAAFVLIFFVMAALIAGSGLRLVRKRERGKAA